MNMDCIKIRSLHGNENHTPVSCNNHACSKSCIKNCTNDDHTCTKTCPNDDNTCTKPCATQNDRNA